MSDKPIQNFEYLITEVREYVVTASGRTRLEADQDAIGRFHRLIKSGDLQAYNVSKPRIAEVYKLK